MKKVIYIPVVLALLTLANCSSPYRVFHDLDPSAHFEAYSTYSFLDWTDGNKNTITAMERERIRTAVARGLEDAGLKFQSEGADIKVKITVYFREAREYFYYSPTTYNYIERAIALDLFEAGTKKHVWHSAVVGEVEQDPGLREEELPGLVSRLMEHYPGKKSI